MYVLFTSLLLCFRLDMSDVAKWMIPNRLGSGSIRFQVCYRDVGYAVMEMGAPRTGYKAENGGVSLHANTDKVTYFELAFQGSSPV